MHQHPRLRRSCIPALLLSLLLPLPALAQDAPALAQDAAPAQKNDQDALIRNALRAGPESITREAAVMDWSMNELRAGTNGWTCLPDNADTPGDDPWCLDAPWLDFLQAYVTQTDPGYTGIGFAYMLMGDTPVSNSDPYATGPTTEADWVTDVGAHVMVIIPDGSFLDSVSTDHMNGGPWVMWPGTPYAHLMIPFASR